MPDVCTLRVCERKNEEGPVSGRGQIIDKGRGVWMVRAPLGREPGTGKRLYHSKTIHGTKRDAQQYLTRVLRELDDGPMSNRVASRSVSA